MNISALPYVILLAFFFGSSLVVSRFSVSQFEPTTYIGIRMIISSLLALAVYSLATGRRLPRDPELWKRASLLGVFGTAIPMTCVVTSLQYLSSGVASLLLATGPALTVLLANFLLPEEALNRRQVLGVSLAMGGALLLALSGENGLPDAAEAAPIGYLLTIFGTVSGSLMVIYARKRLREYDAYDVGSIRIFTTALTVMSFSLLTVGFDGSAVDGAGLLALCYSALVGTFLGLLLSFYNVKRFGATPAMMTTYIIPIVAGIGGAVFLGEVISSTMLVGMIIIISGIALLQEFRKPTGLLRRFPHRGSY
ncbi:MAG: DMT family transporter [Chloroflexi bacterium]|nr:DMT family transporter [Chloroflexota bacterium]